MRTENYSTYLKKMAALVGIPPTRITTELAAVWNVHFDTAIQRAWKLSNWIDLCPFGEARFVGNQLEYPNDLSKTAYWTSAFVTSTYPAAGIPNPQDGRINVSKVTETATTAGHAVAQASTFLPNVQYRVSAWLRPNGRDYAVLSAIVGGVTIEAAFYFPTATVYSTSNCTATCGQQAAGFQLCTMSFTTSATAASGTVYAYLSTDGTTNSYLGSTSKSMYVWGFLCTQTSDIGQDSQLLEWDQLGENEIECVFQVYQTNPTASQYPQIQSYVEVPGGIQMISGLVTQYYVNGIAQNQIFGAPPINPCYLYYRRKCPEYTGVEFDATDTYAVGEQIYFVNSIGEGNFYKCIVATSAGQDPDDTPSKWELIEIPEVLFWNALYQSFADWLISDGQQDKAVGMYAVADSKLQDEFDRQERQMGRVMPWIVSTHLNYPARV